MPRFAITFKPHYSYLLHDRVPLSPTTLPGNIDKLPWLLVGSPLFVRLLDLYVCTGVKADSEGGTAAAAPMLPRSFFVMGYPLTPLWLLVSAILQSPGMGYTERFSGAVACDFASGLGRAIGRESK